MPQDVPELPPKVSLDPVLSTTVGPCGLVTPGPVLKRWGHESLYANDDYCLKRLFIKAGHSTSLHFHMDKHETLLVIDGALEVEYIDREGQRNEIQLMPWDALQIAPGFMHKLRALTDCIIVEGSTKDHPQDSYRVEK